tara:strand:- start:228 stop:395 length:168 start_codon:yes stop_codon:yes gene_type:complete
MCVLILTNHSSNALDLYPWQKVLPASVDFSSRFPAIDFKTAGGNFVPVLSKSTLP